VPYWERTSPASSGCMPAHGRCPIDGVRTPSDPPLPHLVCTLSPSRPSPSMQRHKELLCVTSASSGVVNISTAAGVVAVPYSAGDLQATKPSVLLEAIIPIAVVAVAAAISVAVLWVRREGVANIKHTELSELSRVAHGGLGNIYSAQYKGKCVMVKEVREVSECLQAAASVQPPLPKQRTPRDVTSDCVLVCTWRLRAVIPGECGEASATRGEDPSRHEQPKRRSSVRALLAPVGAKFENVHQAQAAGDGHGRAQDGLGHLDKYKRDNDLQGTVIMLLSHALGLLLTHWHPHDCTCPCTFRRTCA
jgi:hypothetical protein